MRLYCCRVNNIDGVLLEEADFRIRCVTLDHQTPVLAFAFEPGCEFNVRKDRLKAMGLEPGPWLGELKHNLRQEALQRAVGLPDGSRRTTAELAHGAHTFFCESTFLEEDHDQALRTAHLTTRACGEIAEAARVARLIPFHFSRRYEGRLAQVYEEIAAYCGAVARRR